MVTCSNTNRITLYTQYASTTLSLYAIADKLINDDKKIFIKQSGANKSWKPHPQWIIRVLFRICEIISNLFVFVIIAVFYGATWLAIHYIFLLVVNFILYNNGLLGEESYNIIAYTFAIMNLGVTPKVSPKQNERLFLSALYQKIISCLYLSLLKWMPKNGKKKKRDYFGYLSYYYLTSRALQSSFILSVTLILFVLRVDWGHCPICTDFESRFAQSDQLMVFIIIALVASIAQYILYILFFNSMHLGTSLLRDTRTLVINHQFADAIRLETMKINGYDRMSITEQTIRNYQIYERLLTIIIDENVPMLLINVENNDASDTISKEQRKEYEYFIKLLHDAPSYVECKDINATRASENINVASILDIGINIKVCGFCIVFFPFLFYNKRIDKHNLHDKHKRKHKNTRTRK